MSETSRTPEEVERSTEKLLQDLKAVVHDGEDLLKAGAEHVSEKGTAVRERLAVGLEAAKATCRKLEEKARAGAQATDKMIREHPYQSIGIAFGIGMLIGILLNRNRD